MRILFINVTDFLSLHLFTFTFEVQLFSLHNQNGLEARRKITTNFFAIPMAELDWKQVVEIVFGKILRAAYARL